LIYIFCEAYLDDVIVHANTEEEFVENLRAVFSRFRQHNIRLNPKKTVLGKSEIEYVGHVINHEGMSFSRSKLDSVMNFPKPKYGAQMKSFLGLANYFRDHVHDHSALVRPLQKMIASYDRHRKLEWTEATTLAFETLKEAIHNCPKLFFLDDKSPVHLYTDASDYGIGAYLCKLVDSKELPIAFISKTLSSQQQRWSTPEKEAYAIYYALVKLEYLLLDRHFTLHTDHKNLTFMDMSANAKVNRWKIFLQEYDFQVEYIKGPLNVIADSFSRLCLLNEISLNSSEQEAYELLCLEELCVLEDLKTNLDQKTHSRISKCHNSNVGHHGVERTVAKLIASGQEWTRMRQDVKLFIRKCPCCQLMSQVAPAIASLPFTLSTFYPMDCLSVDSIGPLPMDSDGHIHILVVIDNFSRFVELYPLTDLTAKHAAEALLSHIGRYGAPRRLLSDGGPQFINETIRELLILIGTQHEITLAYSKEENAIVERANKEVLRHLRAIIYERGVITEWYKYLPLVQRIMNASIHEALGVSPAQILFGNALNLDRQIMVNFSELRTQYASEINLSQWQSDMLKKQAHIIELAQRVQIRKNEAYIATKNAAYKDKGLTVFAINSFVLVAYPPNSWKKGPPNKLMMQWQGPYKVMDRVGNRYRVLHLANMSEEEVHVCRLKSFITDDSETARQTANRAEDKWDVERILSHTGNPKYRTKMTFQVKWVGFNELTTETWNRDLIKTQAMHVYLSNNNLRSLIPSRFRDNPPRA
jgi:hypothetical protein